MDLDKRVRDLAMKLRQVGRLQFGRIFGTALPTHGRYKAMIDLLERSYFIRAEISAFTALLVEKKVVTREELLARFGDEYEQLLGELAKQFPEVEFGTDGFTIKDSKALQRRSRDEQWPP